MSSTDTVTSQLAINQLNAVYFVNHDLADLATLLAGVPQGAEVVLLDPTQDGLSQMLTALDGRSGLDAIHLIGHGASGLIDLGSASVTTDANGNTTVNNNGTGTSIVPNPTQAQAAR